MGLDVGHLDYKKRAVAPSALTDVLADVDMTCGNCTGRSGEECEVHGGREVYLDEKPDWCDKWEEAANAEVNGGAAATLETKK